MFDKNQVVYRKEKILKYKQYFTELVGQLNNT